MPLSPGSVVTLKCLGTEPGSTYLDGRTGDGSVGLAPNTDPPHGGTAWSVLDAGQSRVFLKCLGSLSGPRYLTVTSGGSVVLQPAQSTAWIVDNSSQGDLTLQRVMLPQAGAGSPGAIWLNGETATGTVNLAPRTSAPYTGTHWAPTAFVLREDQAQPVRLSAMGGMDEWQSFTAGVTGLMTRLDVMVSSPLGSNPASGSIRVYQGLGILGQLLADVPFTFRPVSGTFQECDFPTPFPIEQGRVYTFRLAVPTAVYPWIGANLAGAYLRGVSSLVGYVMVFRTWVMVNPGVARY